MNFQSTTDQILLGAVGVKFESTLGIDSWSLVGNAGTNSAANFLGTTDNQALVIKTNGVEAMRVNTDGKVGIGTPSPSDELHIKEMVRGTIARFEGNGQGSVVFFDGAATDRGRMGFGSAGQIFLEGLPNSFAIRSEAALHLGVGSDVVMTIREIGYPPGTGYIGIGTAEPTAILTVAGEDSPRIHIISNSGGHPSAPPSRTWGLISFTDGSFNITDITASVDRCTFTSDGDVRIAGRLLVKSTGSVNLAPGGAILTNATDGFTYIPTCAGVPTGVPTPQTGSVAMVYDTTNNNFYIYNGAWKKVGLT